MRPLSVRNARIQLHEIKALQSCSPGNRTKALALWQHPAGSHRALQSRTRVPPPSNGPLELESGGVSPPLPFPRFNELVESRCLAQSAKSPTDAVLVA
ncbi:hypothetical protein C7G41_34555 [Bradyrhizobium sp. MOS002]|nr:hypothetical protein C7G41_34555 [Bradyrhizobium sp. MOS002]